MIRPIKVIDAIKENLIVTDLETVEKYETIDALWGIEHIKLTDADINALKEGKYLYCNDYEYANIISYEPQSILWEEKTTKY